MDALSPAQDKSYSIKYAALIWSIPFSSIQTTQVPACGYTQTFTSTATSVKIIPKVETTSISYSAQSNDVLDAGVYHVTVTSTLNNSPTSTSQSTFKVTFVDPCLNTSFNSMIL